MFLLVLVIVIVKVDIIGTPLFLPINENRFPVVLKTEKPIRDDLPKSCGISSPELVSEDKLSIQRWVAVITNYPTSQP